MATVDKKKNRKEQNTLFPVFLKLEKLKVLVVGGGDVALEKLSALFQNCPDAKVKLVGTLIKPQTEKFLSANKIFFEERPFAVTDLEDTDLVIIAINDKNISKEIQQCCSERRILTNVADTPELCNFYLGSIVQKGNLKLAISTNGKSPTIAKRVKEVLIEAFPDEMDDVLDNMAIIRNRLKGDFSDKVRQLNEITNVLATTDGSKRKYLSATGLIIAAVFFIAMGYFLFFVLHN
ncbi:precorrin-2 dehydrogenase/sirohydrochlorin ferrochelatase family protein [Rubrolithibacter danxiaensis]|uniref:precorrin-2 dehydrogenase/sirohydrochlorin ferrochelatase family protein n=1 Tax=Rubrolithibacter danxiaensis TaxID=3390805 RepID=UPI003BF8CCA0